MRDDLEMLVHGFFVATVINASHIEVKHFFFFLANAYTVYSRYILPIAAIHKNITIYI
jgi:predicted peroxiredoxin